MFWTLTIVPIAMVTTALICRLLVNRAARDRASNDERYDLRGISSILCLIAGFLAGILVLMAVGLWIIATTISDIVF